MTDSKSLPSEILLHIAQTLNLPMRGLVAVIELLDARVRITVSSDTDRAVLAMVLDVLDRRGR